MVLKVNLLTAFGLCGRIRTYDILLPKQVLYQTELHIEFVLVAGWEF